MAKTPRAPRETDAPFVRAVREAQQQTGVELKTVQTIVEAFVAGLEWGLIIGQRVNVPGFGVFSIRTRKARRIKNLQGEWREVPATKEVFFRAAGELKHKANRSVQWRQEP